MADARIRTSAWPSTRRTSRRRRTTTSLARSSSTSTAPSTRSPLYTIFSAPSTAAANLNSAAGTTQSNNNALYLASSFDGGVSWADTPIYVGPLDQTVDHIFPTLSIDAGGVLWAAWSTNAHIYVSHASTRNASSLLASGTDFVSTDAIGQLVPETFLSPATQPAGTLPWSSPVQLDQPGTTANVFAWVTGGGANRADVVYYSGTGQGSGPDDATAQWVVGFSQLHDTNKGLVVMSATASDHVMHSVRSARRASTAASTATATCSTSSR